MAFHRAKAANEKEDDYPNCEANMSMCYYESCQPDNITVSGQNMAMQCSTVGMK